MPLVKHPSVLESGANPYAIASSIVIWAGATGLSCNGRTYTMAEVEAILREHEGRKRGL